jgi:hypothetical protein
MRFQPVVALLLFASAPAYAWNGFGHMTVAYIAYKHLDDRTRTRVDSLLQLNPEYKIWTEGVVQGDKGLVAFMKAATWPDCIRHDCPGYEDRGGSIPPDEPESAQNIGYADKLMHKYWHFVDLPYSPRHLPVLQPKEPNAKTQIVAFMQRIGDSDATDDIKSYDVVWLEHLIGDVQQPLHCTSRFTKALPKGDNGGNGVKFCQECAGADLQGATDLHAYWDGLLGPGSYPSVDAVEQVGKALNDRPKPAGGDNVAVQDWIDEGFKLAKQYVYVPPIDAEEGAASSVSAKPSEAYAAAAKKIAESRVLLGGYRLAQVLKTRLK